MSAYSLYALPADDLATTAVITASAEDSGYVAANLAQAYDANLNRPAKLTTTSGNWVLDLGTAQTINYAALVYHNLDAALDVKLEGNATDSWGAPSFSQAFTIPTWQADDWTLSPYITCSGTRTFRYWRLLVNAANSLTVDVRRLMLLSTLRTFPADIRMGYKISELHRDIGQETDLGIPTFYDLGGKERMIDGETPTVGTAVETFRELRRAVSGHVKPWLFIPDSRVNDAWYVRFTEATGSGQHWSFPQIRNKEP